MDLLLDVAAAALTLATLAALAAGGYLLALLALRGAAAADPLRFAVAWLLCSVALGVVLALLLGVMGWLFLPAGLAAAGAKACAGCCARRCPGTA